MKSIDLYTDGSCRGNPGAGGYGCILRYQDPDGHVYEKTMSGGYGLTTNNRMELMAAIIGLEALREPCRVTLYSDSSYLINAYQKGWLAKWIENGWYKDKKKKEAVKNRDLWIRLEAARSRHELTFVWVKGHADNTDNNRCDEMAVSAATDALSHLAPTCLEEENADQIPLQI